MKTFDEIVEEVFYKRESERLKEKLDITVKTKYIPKKEQAHKLLSTSYERSQVYAKHPDVSEPIITVCKLVLEKPNRFCLQDSTESGKTVIVDKFNNQKFIMKTFRGGIWYPYADREVIYPSFLTEDENKLLVEAIQEWYGFMSDKIRKEREKREQKRKDDYRQEMIDLYKENM